MKLDMIAVIGLLAGLAAFSAAGEVKINTTEVDGRLVDDIDLPFVNDPAVLGDWVSVDFVKTPELFVPGTQAFQGDLYLKGLKFKAKGKLGLLPDGWKAVPWFAWTKGVVMHLGGDHSASRYTIEEISGSTYMFFEWKSGDYIIKHQKPQYYVLRKK